MAVWALIGLLLSSPAAALPSILPSPQDPTGSPTPTDDRTPHAPIKILDDTDLLLPDLLSGNGVVRGHGTATDPFVIEGWEIRFTWTKPALFIHNTSLHLVLRNLLLRPETPPKPSDFASGPALVISGAANVTLDSVRIEDDWGGLPNFIDSEVHARRVTLANATLSAEGGRLRIEDLEAHGTTRVRTAVLCFGCTLETKRVQLWGYGPVARDDLPQLVEPGVFGIFDGTARLEDVHVWNAGNATIVYVINSSLTWARGYVDGGGILVWGIKNAQIRLSDIEHHPYRTVGSAGYFDNSHVEIHRLRVFGPAGISVSGGTLRIEESLLDGAAHGVMVGITLDPGSNPTPTVVIHNSSFLNTQQTGVNNQAPGAQVDARWNWWGSPDGPVRGLSKGGRAGVEGDVQVEPWLTEGPAPHARASPGLSAWLVLGAFVLATAAAGTGALRRHRQA